MHRGFPFLVKDVNTGAYFVENVPVSVGFSLTQETPGNCVFPGEPSECTFESLYVLNSAMTEIDISKIDGDDLARSMGFSDVNEMEIEAMNEFLESVDSDE